MGKIAAISVLVVLFGITGAASATICTIELPDLVGEVGEYPTGPTAAFDFGTSFLSIDELRIEVRGTFTPGLARSTMTGQLFEFSPEIWLLMDSGVGYCYADLHPLESPFDLEEKFELDLDATWDFLLDGRDEVIAFWTNAFSGDVVVLTKPTSEISEAYLTVEGVIPEPASILLMALGGAGVRWSKRKS